MAARQPEAIGRTMTLQSEQRFYMACRFVLGSIFIWASWDKIFDPQGFVRIIENYRLLPSLLIQPVALVLPWVEMFSGITLISGYLIKGSAMIINILTTIFIIAIGINMFRGLNIHCGCFSNSGEASGKLYLYLIRDGLLLATGIWIYYYRIKQERIRALSLI
jgi:uncharacterized membrane protein YphA (DoxX/SURF4 family)